MAPSPDQAALLAEVDLATVPGRMIVDVLQAEYRQLAHQQARVLAAIAELARRDPAAPDPAAPLGAPRRLDRPDPDAVFEIAAALRLGHGPAWRELDFADTLVHRLPDIHQALGAGLIDRGRAWVFVAYLGDCADETIALACRLLLPRAAGWTTGQLRVRLARLLIDLDPDAAARRYRRALRERTVTTYPSPDGTMTIAASGLSVEDAAACCEHIEQLAAAVKRAGHPARIGAIRADLFTALTDGSFQQLGNEQIIEAMLARPVGVDDLPDAPGAPPPPTRSSGKAGSAAGARAGIEVRARLTTLLGLDELSGEIAGLGATPADACRRAVARQQRGEWRFAVTDADGYLLLAGLTRRRPAGGSAEPQSTGGIVELQVPADRLAELGADRESCGAWWPVVADLARQFAARSELTEALRDQAHARFPGAALRRHVEVRDRNCTHPGCRRRAARSHHDHTHDHGAGGPTTAENLGPACPAHHRLKTVGRWWVEQPEPGHFIWWSPFGRGYRTRGEPITPDPPERGADDGPRPPPGDERPSV